MGLRRSLGELLFDWPLSQDSEELRGLLSGNINIASTGLPSVSEADAWGVPSFARGVDLIASTIAGLPWKTYAGEGQSRVEVDSLLDHPQGEYAMSTFDWLYAYVRDLVAYREAYHEHIVNSSGALVALRPVPPGAVQKVEWVGFGKQFTVHYSDNSTKVFGSPGFPTGDGVVSQTLGPGSNGLRGVSMFVQYRRLFQTAIAAQNATGRVFTGALIRGVVTTAQDEDVDEEEAIQIVDKLNARISGSDNAGQMAFVNRHLVFTPWQQTNLDAQFAETMAHVDEEFARALGLPPHLLALIDKQTSWGTGIAEQNIGLARYCLRGYSDRMEETIVQSKWVGEGEFTEADYKGLLQGSPKEEIELLLKEVGGPILTADEARATINMGPMPKPKVEPVAKPTQIPKAVANAS